MKFEHFALNVSDARAVALWYVNHLGLRVVRSISEPPYRTFLADETGRVFLELYTNTSVTVPDYNLTPPLNFHLAFVADDPKATLARLEAAGGSPFQEEKSPDGSVLIMMRDPWGIPLQLCYRAKPF
jgi:catechol 2,3-dioxygenase-like lactoylglutathione lyase family enzyme